MSRYTIKGVPPIKFSSDVKKRGRWYYTEGRVIRLTVNGHFLTAEVEGSEAVYDVVVDGNQSSEHPHTYCSCPYFERAAECKHVWAVLLAAEREGYLQGVTTKPKADKPYNVSLTRIPASKSLANTPHKPDLRLAWKRKMTFAQNLDHRFAPLAPTESAATTDRNAVFVLDPKTSAQRSCVHISLLYRERKKNGEWGKAKPLYLDLNPWDEWAGNSDLPLLRLLNSNDSSEEHGYGYYSYSDLRTSTIHLEGENTPAILHELAATGRLGTTKDLRSFEWEQFQPLTTSAAELWQTVLTATNDPQQDLWTICGELRCADQRLPISSVDEVLGNGRFAVVLAGTKLLTLAQPSDASWILTLKNQGDLEIPSEHRVEFVQEWWKLTAPPLLEAPADFALPQVQLPVSPLLKIRRPSWDKDRRGAELYGNVFFQYGDVSIPASQAGSGVVSADGSQVLLRDHAAEVKHVEALVQAGIRIQDSSNHYGDRRAQADFVVPAKQLMALVAQMAAIGWQVEAEGNIIRSAGKFSCSVQSGVDWFDLDAEFDFGGAVAKLPALLAALRKGEKYVLLSDGTQGMLPQEWLAKFGFLADLGADEAGKVRFKSSQGLLLDALLASQPNVKYDKRFAAWRKKLESFSGVQPASAPAKFKGELRKYQEEGLGWLQFLREFQFGGCLADDMGLGKTVQVLALLQARRQELARKKRRPSLIVVPRSLVFNWKQEAARFTPDLVVLDFAGAGRSSLRDQLETADIVLTTYGTLLKDIEQWQDFEFDYVILDEAQAIKNSAAQCTKACRLLKAEHRLALTGTPIENHLGELWSLFEFLNPGMLGQSAAFQRFTREAANGDAAGRGLLSRAIAPFVLRRTKKQVLKDLPEKTEQTIFCDLSTKERKKYNELKTFYQHSLSAQIATTGLEKSKIHVLEALLRLRQASCHLGLLDAKHQKETSAKLEALFEQLDELVAEGHKALIFSQFTSLLAIVKKHLDKQKVVYEYLDGETRDREGRVQRFQTDEKCPLFLISLKAGGKGLNLTAADYVFILDPWWNPAVEAQAIDRVHRLGQDKPVFAYRLIARDTVEEKILQLQDGKRNLADSIISADSSLLKGLTPEDLQLLLS